MAVSTSSLPNAYHLGIATCSHCGVTMLATHAIQCPSCQSANYCSEKCMSQHAMSTHHTYACQSLLRASQEKAARALAAEVRGER